MKIQTEPTSTIQHYICSMDVMKFLGYTFILKRGNIIEISSIPTDSKNICVVVTTDSAKWTHFVDKKHLEDLIKRKILRRYK